MSTEALKLALEALEKGVCVDPEDSHRAIYAIREALAQQPAQKRPQNCGTGYCSCIECVMEPQQEPVALGYMNAGHVHEMKQGRLPYGYIYPKGDAGANVAIYTSPPAQPQQELFEYWNAVEGWVKIDEVRQHFDSVGCGTIYKTAGEDRVPLYTSSPSQRKPLTDEEIETVWRSVQANDFHDCVKPFARAIEAVHGIKGDA